MGYLLPQNYPFNYQLFWFFNNDSINYNLLGTKACPNKRRNNNGVLLQGRVLFFFNWNKQKGRRLWRSGQNKTMHWEL